jgi:hypothetical protein
MATVRHSARRSPGAGRGNTLSALLVVTLLAALAVAGVDRVAALLAF